MTGVQTCALPICAPIAARTASGQPRPDEDETVTMASSPISSAANRADTHVNYISNAGKVTTIQVGATDAADGPNGLGTSVCAMFGTAITF